MRTWYCSRPTGHEGAHRAHANHDLQDEVTWLGPWTDGTAHPDVEPWIESHPGRRATAAEIAQDLGAEAAHQEYVVANYSQQPADWFDTVSAIKGVEVVDVVERKHNGMVVPVIALIRADGATIARVRKAAQPNVVIAPKQAGYLPSTSLPRPEPNLGL